VPRTSTLRPYVTKEELRALVADMILTGIMSETLAEHVVHICVGIQHRYGFKSDGLEVASLTCIALLKSRNSIDLSNNLFAYITTVAMNLHKYLYTQDKKYHMAIDRMAARLSQDSTGGSRVLYVRHQEQEA
jgi:DNA-directed RNA polymerase specialized sigma24 family protein